MNTRMLYLYTDADNYKVFNKEILKGEITEEQVKAIEDCLSEGEFFIPEQVGLENAERFGSVTEADHCWFTIIGFELTERKPGRLDTDTLVENFLKAKGRWNDARYMPGGEPEEKYKVCGLQFPKEEGILAQEMYRLMDLADGCRHDIRRIDGDGSAAVFIIKPELYREWECQDILPQFDAFIREIMDGTAVETDSSVYSFCPVTGHPVHLPKHAKMNTEPVEIFFEKI